MKNYLPCIVVVLIIAGAAYVFSNKKASNNTDTQGIQHDMNSIVQEPEGGNPVAQSHRSYNIQLTSSPNNIEPGQPAKISYKILNDKEEVLKDYAVAHEKIMHFIVVRKDLRYFQHLHPDFNRQTGEFSVNVTFPGGGPYRIFPDFTPTPENPMKLAVTVNQDLNVGDMNKYKPQNAAADTDMVKPAGIYRVYYYFPENLKAQNQIDYSLVVEKTGEIVELEPYLGAMGHGVIIREGSLDFIHTHAGGMDMEGMENTDMGSMQGMNHQGEPDTIDFSTSFPGPGIYKIFTQFQVKGKVITSDYAVQVK